MAMFFDILSCQQLEIHGQNLERVYDGEQRGEGANEQREFVNHDQTTHIGWGLLDSASPIRRVIPDAD
jgi:hypothetical protein